MAPLIFPLGSSPGQQECFNLQQFINDDLFVENLENFRIMLSSTDASARFTAGRDCATANINDNDRRFLVVIINQCKQKAPKMRTSLIIR